MVSACVCSNAGIDSTDVKDTALSEDYNFNPMTREGMRKVRESASKNVRTYLAKKYNCVVNESDRESFGNQVNFWIPIHRTSDWEADDKMGYIEISWDGWIMRRYSADGRLMAVGSPRKLYIEEEKKIREKCLKTIGKTEAEAKAANPAPIFTDPYFNTGSIVSALMSPSLSKAAYSNANQRVVASQDEQKFQLLAFTNAIQKAKIGDGEGLYALALHFAKGDEIKQDSEKARKYLDAAVAADFPMAVLLQTMIKEASLLNFGYTYLTCPDTQKYTGGLSGGGVSADSFGKWNVGLSVTNAQDIATIRSGYKKAIDLGVLAATNELARFNTRLEQHEKSENRWKVVRRRQEARKETKAKNAILVEELEKNQGKIKQNGNH